MPFRNWQVRIQDVLESIHEIEVRIGRMTFEDFARNPTVVKAVLYDFIIIGEATSNIPIEIQARYPLIPWRLIKGMRNVTTHEYFQMDSSRVWTTVQDDLPLLATRLQRIPDNEAGNCF
jgi:uncharacterized protein with HEPN domain